MARVVADGGGGGGAEIYGHPEKAASILARLLEDNDAGVRSPML